MKALIRSVPVMAMLMTSQVLTAQTAVEAPAGVAAFDVRQIMSAQEYKDTGLDKLNQSEIAALNTWLGKSFGRVQLARQIMATNAGPASPAQAASAVESAIDGDFEGWTGETIFKLQNGQIWQQAEYAYEYNYDYSPDVTIYRAQGCWKMLVKGMGDTICVRRLK